MALPDFELVLCAAFTALLRLERYSSERRGGRPAMPTQTPIDYGSAEVREQHAVGTGATESAVRKASRTNFRRVRTSLETRNSRGWHPRDCPAVNTTGSPEVRSVATTARGMRRFSNCRDSNTRRSNSPGVDAGQAEARNGAQRAMSRSGACAGLNNVRERCTTGVGSTQDAPHTGSCDVRDGMWFCSRGLAATPRCAKPRPRNRHQGLGRCLPA